ncbi:Mycobacterium numidiamassiliense ORFan [Mycobacterium numidiamassiliense]|uniref:Mycobacterium numidiamassiliense ORFan n=1 Tax=Mycobacterium numidiamassiliense TaxID=1841861 RepID=A0A2U3PFI3_9MYCO|nr:Mycobacterium numidiamassiliense ORFan [Mycobacterium numidiamassiliense]
MTVQAVLDEVRERPGTGDVIPIFDPSTEEQITEFTDGGVQAVNDAVARAKASAESGIWSAVLGRASDACERSYFFSRHPRSNGNRHALGAINW